MRRTTPLIAALVASAVLACSGADGSSRPGSAQEASSTHTVTTFAGAAQFPFDETSAHQFPGTSLDGRLEMAQQVCDSIRSHGNDYVAWLKLSKTSRDLV